VATKRREWTLLTLTMGERCRHGRGNERPGERCSKVRCCYSYGCIYRLIVDCLRVGCEMRFSWFRGFVCVVLGMCLSGVLGWRADVKVRWAGLRGRETARSVDRSPLFCTIQSPPSPPSAPPFRSPPTLNRPTPFVLFARMLRLQTNRKSKCKKSFSLCTHQRNTS
jgi:hypothetical protein